METEMQQEHQISSEQVFEGRVVRVLSAAATTCRGRYTTEGVRQNPP